MQLYYLPSLYLDFSDYQINKSAHITLSHENIVFCFIFYKISILFNNFHIYTCVSKKEKKIWQGSQRCPFPILPKTPRVQCLKFSGTVGGLDYFSHVRVLVEAGLI